MNYSVSDYTTIAHKFRDLGIISPENISFLPDNIDEVDEVDKLYYADSVVDLKKIFKKNHILIDDLTPSNSRYMVKKSADWYGPALFIGYSLFSENDKLVSVTLSVIANYVTDFFKGSFGNKTIKFDIVIETKKGKEYKKSLMKGRAKV